MTGRDLLGCLYENSLLPLDAILEIRDYGNVEALCALIEREEVAVLHVKEARDLILKILRSGGLHRGNGKRTETARIKDRRDEWIVRQMHYWKGFGLKEYGGSDKNTYAVVVVANELERVADKYGWKAVDADRIIKIWKEHKKQTGMHAASNALNEAYGMMLRKKAIDDSDLRNKITKEFDLRIDWTKLKRQPLPAWLDGCGST
jgi:hypothetical protein